MVFDFITIIGALICLIIVMFYLRTDVFHITIRRIRTAMIFLIEVSSFFIISLILGYHYSISKFKNYRSSTIVFLLSFYGSTIGENVIIDSGITIHRFRKIHDLKKISIGSNCYLGHNIILDITKKIVIGKNTAFGANCQIWTHTGDWSYDRNDEKDYAASVNIGKGIICYSGVVLSPGISIGDYARIAGNSIVINDIKALSFNGGVPAKFIRNRNLEK